MRKERYEKENNWLSNAYKSKDRVCAADKDGRGVCAKNVDSESDAELPKKFSCRLSVYNHISREELGENSKDLGAQSGA